MKGLIIVLNLLFSFSALHASVEIKKFENEQQ